MLSGVYMPVFAVCLCVEACNMASQACRFMSGTLLQFHFTIYLFSSQVLGKNLLLLFCKIDKVQNQLLITHPKIYSLIKQASFFYQMAMNTKTHNFQGTENERLHNVQHQMDHLYDIPPSNTQRSLCQCEQNDSNSYMWQRMDGNNGFQTVCLFQKLGVANEIRVIETMCTRSVQTQDR